MQERPNHNLAAEYEPEIRTIEARYDAAWNRSDPDALAANLADDAVVVNPYGDVVEGRAAFRSLIADLLDGRFAGSRHEGSIRRIQFVAPDVALVDGEARITGLKGEPTTMVHAFTDVFVRRNDRWEIAAIRAYVFSPPDGEPASDRR